LPSKLDNIGGETLLVRTTARDLALRRAMLPERRTGVMRLAQANDCVLEIVELARSATESTCRASEMELTIPGIDLRQAMRQNVTPITS